MKVSYSEEIANHADLESCVVVGDCGDEALTGGDAGRVLSREITEFRAPTLWTEAEGETDPFDIARTVKALRGQRPRIYIQAPRAGAGRSHVWPGMASRSVSATPCLKITACCRFQTASTSIAKRAQSTS